MDYELTETDRKFFDITEPCGWGTTTTDSKALLVELLRMHHSYRSPQTVWLNNHCSKLTGILHGAVRGDLDTDFCSDGWSDALAHIVGLGRHEFLKCMYDPQKIVDRFESGDYTESFHYALPSGDEYLNCQLATHQQRAAQYLGQLTARHMVGWEHKANVLVLASLAHLALGDVKKFLENKDRVLSILERERNEINMGWGIDNLYSDIEQYKEFFE